MCNVGNYPDEVKQHIRQDVCRNLVAGYEVGDAANCLLHAPTIDKNKDEFDRIFKERISRNDYNFQAVVFPARIAATLQNVDYRKPTTKKGEIAIILEKIFAPLQAALLALAIRRKFMR